MNVGGGADGNPYIETMGVVSVSPVEKRREAVSFCVLNGLSAGAAARILGWPSPRALYLWMADAGVPGVRERRANAAREVDVMAEELLMFTRKWSV